ncbi:uncharacterized protein DNG_03754 [Cephalotrichum gorgonifer]|uniref:Non-haem dioxygenase N-terminal domain-containing protein n=1 Tax=Cephalotrichum gorgonifer TaxID=2041049 RepID=A0AAE8SUK2_9PEZI|nr:uncharacterized protein DNG_03754 [Cephalotrichum gorgonifer]
MAGNTAGSDVQMIPSWILTTNVVAVHDLESAVSTIAISSTPYLRGLDRINPAIMAASSPDDVPMELPVVDLDVFLNNPRDSAVVLAECQKAADALVTFGALVLHDSRATESDNAAFLDLLEDYFAQPEERLREDERPELGFQVGVTLENTEKPKCAVDEPCLDVIQRLAESERPLDISGHEPDPKCRFFWKMAEKPPFETEFPGLNAPNVVPRDPAIRARWEPTLHKWGTTMKNA